MTFNKGLEATEGLSGVAYLSCGLYTGLAHVLWGQTSVHSFIHHLLLWVYDNIEEVTKTSFQCASDPAEQPDMLEQHACTWTHVPACQTTSLAPKLYSGSFHYYTPCIWIVILTTLMKQSQIAWLNTNGLQVQSNTKNVCQFDWSCDSPGYVCKCCSLLQSSVPMDRTVHSWVV